MKSDRPKVLHRVAGRTLIRYVLDALARLAPARTILVLAPEMEAVAHEAAGAQVAIQPTPLGTGHAALAAYPALADLIAERRVDDVLVVFGDTPFLATATLAAMIEERRSAHAATVEAANQAAIVALPSTAWREIQDRATTLGIAADLRTGLATGPNPGDPVRTELRLTTEIADVPETG